MSSNHAYEDVDRAETERAKRDAVAGLDYWICRRETLAEVLEECARSVRGGEPEDIGWVVDQMLALKTSLESVALHLNHAKAEEAENG